VNAKPKLSSALLLSLLKRASAHVYRQQFHGRHDQDREDAKELWTELKQLGVID